MAIPSAARLYQQENHTIALDHFSILINDLPAAEMNADGRVSSDFSEYKAEMSADRVNLTGHGSGAGAHRSDSPVVIMPMPADVPAYFVDDSGRFVLYKGDCLELMGLIPPEQFDLIFADPPYTTAN